MESPESKSEETVTTQVQNDAIQTVSPGSSPEASTKRKSRRGLRFTTGSLLLLVTLVCVAFSVVSLNSETVLYGHLSGQYSSIFNVDLNADVEELVARLNSPELIDEMMGENPDHYRILSKWKDDRHGFSKTLEVKGSASKSFELRIDIPIYCVRSRRFKWRSLWEDSFFTDGPIGKEARVGELNRELYVVFLDKVTQELAIQSGRTKN